MAQILGLRSVLKILRSVVALVAVLVVDLGTKGLLTKKGLGHDIVYSHPPTYAPKTNNLIAATVEKNGEQFLSRVDDSSERGDEVPWATRHWPPNLVYRHREYSTLLSCIRQTAKALSMRSEMIAR